MSESTSSQANVQKPMTRRDLESRIVAKAWKDADYKKRLLADPKAVLQDELTNLDPSITLPDSLKVQVHEENADLFHLVLPRNPNDISLGEVVGDNLEAVAPQTIAVVVVGAAVVAAGTVAVVTHLGAANVVGAANATVTANAVANSNAVA